MAPKILLGSLRSIQHSTFGGQNGKGGGYRTCLARLTALQPKATWECVCVCFLGIPRNGGFPFGFPLKPNQKRGTIQKRHTFEGRTKMCRHLTRGKKQFRSPVIATPIQVHTHTTRMLPKWLALPWFPWQPNGGQPCYLSEQSCHRQANAHLFCLQIHG